MANQIAIIGLIPFSGLGMASFHVFDVVPELGLLESMGISPISL